MSLYYDQKCPRKFFKKSTSDEISRAEVVDLNAIQKESYDVFINGKNKEVFSIERIIKSFFPIEIATEYAKLEYIDHSLENNIYDEDDCKKNSLTYSHELKVRFKLTVYDRDSKQKKIVHKAEELVKLVDIPRMTKTGSFVINGTEKFVVSQLHRSPGVLFSHDNGKNHASGALLHQARIIPYKGSWLEFEFDVRGVLSFRIDRKRKMPATILLRALGYDTKSIIKEFCNVHAVSINKKNISVVMEAVYLEDKITNKDIATNEGEVLIKAGTKINKIHIKEIQDLKITKFNFDISFLEGSTLSEDVVSKDGEVIATASSIIDEEIIEIFASNNIKKINIIQDDGDSRYILETLRTDKAINKVDALFEIYHVLRPGDSINQNIAEKFFHELFFDEKRYDLSNTGRMKLNLLSKKSETSLTLTKDDILTVIKKIIDIHNKKEEIDDVDSLSNRRIRSVGEMVANQFQIGLSRIEKAIKDILGSPDVNLKTPKDLLNSKPINSAINEFFVSGQMAQFMDQTNPLSEITHKRRVTVLGPGGLSRDRAGFEVRDVHPTYYGRLCPIETPEGPNIGLISSLAGFTRIDKYGYLTSPYYVVKKGVVTDEIVYCSVFDEENKSIVQKIHLNEDRKMPAGSIGARLNNEFITIDSSKVDYMAVSSRQIVSVATSLIPFLEHNDANRALMGANMQRQAIPVLKAEKPISGTGVERVVALGTGSVVVSKTEGTVINVSSNRIVIQNYNADILKSGNEEEVGIFIYNLIKYSKSNQNTCINQRALVKIGDKVRKGDVIADGSSTQDGDLALGKNIRIAFMSWNGYNFEDAIIISDKLVKEEAFTSIHIESFVCTARVTKQGDEEITTDIPNIKNHALDDSGIVRIGEFVESGGILVGKITPKGATQMNPEEKLLRAIFGEKASDVRDSSLRMPRSMSGRVIDVQVQTRSNVNMERENLIKKEKLSQIKSDKNEELKTVTNLYNLLRELISSCVSPKDKKEIGDISSIKDSDLLKIEVSNKEVTSLQKKISSVKREIENKYKNKTRVLEKLGKVAPGVIAIVKVFVAVKRRIQPGDKMAGRHGNKGVISIIVPEADMPFDENGVPVDMILNPLGVPSRMNIGQILEVHLGMASYGLGLKINSFLKQNEEVKLKQIIGDIYGDKIGGLPVKSLNSDDLKTISKRLVEKGVPFEIPVFDGCDESDVKQILKLAGMPESGRIELFDGHTGNKFDFPVTVGYMYILKLNHLVDDKMHARSTGSYSLVTQQPLSGKAQFGGQRVGEMEVWAFEAYGAAHLLQEILTSKSDDIEGRKKMYKNIVVGENNLSFSTPESFNVLMQEIRALGLNINTEK